MSSGKTSSGPRALRRRVHGAGRRGVVLGVAALLALSAATAGAQGRREPSRESHRIIQLEEEVVEGRIEKPEAFYILQPTNLNYESAEPEQSFLPELLRTVEEAPF
jgi:hypothetical protein